MADVIRLPVKQGPKRRTVLGKPRGDLVPFVRDIPVQVAWDKAEAIQFSRPLEAARLYELCLVSHGSRARIEIGVCFHAAGQIQDAMAQWERVIIDDDTYWQAWFNLGCVYLKSGAYHDARQRFFRATLMAPSEADPWYNLAVCHERMGHDWNAVRCYNQHRRLGGEYAVEAKAAIARSSVITLRGDGTSPP